MSDEKIDGQVARLDLAMMALSATAPEAPAARPDAVEAPTGSERILVVEDDPAVLSTCVDMLAGLGYQVDVAIDGRGALNRLEAAPDYDLLFSDVVMPGGVSGIELALQARRSRPGLKILLTSGYLGDEGLQTDHGFTVLDKPYQRDDLAVCIREALDRTDDRTRAVAV